MRAALPLLAGLTGLVLAAAGLGIAGGMTWQGWWFGATLVAGFVFGALGLLAIGHLMNETWLAPVRDEAEAMGLTAPLAFAIAVPIAFGLPALFPWALPVPPPLPTAREAYLAPAFVLARSAVILSGLSLLGLWLARTTHPRRASGLALALLAPLSAVWAGDWALSRDPLWWSGLFSFGFVVSQLLAALALTMLVALLREAAPPPAMRSLERALLTLLLLTFWTWFVHFLSAWFGNLPEEAAWYLRRAGERMILLYAALAALVLAVAILVPSGVKRPIMIAGCLLVLTHHLAHMLWLTEMPITPPHLLTGAGLLLLWSGVFLFLLRRRPGWKDSPPAAEPEAPARRAAPA